MKVWVTGAKGLLGTSLLPALERQGISSVGSTRDEVDLFDPLSLVRFHRQKGPFTHLFNLAAFTGVDLAEKRPDEAHLVNALLPGLLGQFAKEEGIKPLHISTDYVFDGTFSRPYLESDGASPLNVYGKTKREGEERLLNACPDACIVRTSWLFGPNGKSFVSTMVQLLGQGKSLRVVSDQRGRPTYTPDLALILAEALHWSGIYHVANSGETTWYELALTIQKKLRLGGEIHPISTEEYGAPALRPRYSVLDTKKADLQHGKSLRTWEEGLCAHFNLF
jgi:dTDP-4-dehydrorhamnose reductase